MLCKHTRPEDLALPRAWQLIYTTEDALSQSVCCDRNRFLRYQALETPVPISDGSISAKGIGTIRLNFHQKGSQLFIHYTIEGAFHVPDWPFPNLAIYPGYGGVLDHLVPEDRYEALPETESHVQPFRHTRVPAILTVCEAGCSAHER